jgi:hypothetical protein
MLNSAECPDFWDTLLFILQPGLRRQAALGIFGASSILLSLALSLQPEKLRQDAMPWQQ